MNQQSKKLKFDQKRNLRKNNEQGQALLEYLMVSIVVVTGLSGLIMVVSGDQPGVDRIMGYFVEKLNLLSFVLSMPF
jgi:hypothetical protein